MFSKITVDQNSLPVLLHPLESVRVPPHDRLFQPKKTTTVSTTMHEFVMISSQNNEQQHKISNLKIIVKGELTNMTRAWDKEKIYVPDRNPTHDGRSIH